MKWIGQYIFDFAVRIRNKLYDATGSSGSPASSVNTDLSGSSTGFAKTLTTDGNTVSWTDATFIHSQDVAAHTWSIEHKLNRFPSVTVIDSGNTVIIGNIEYANANELTLTFYKKSVLVAFGGKAYLN